MHFTLTQPFQHPASLVWDALLDPKHAAAVHQLGAIRREPVRDEVVDGSRFVSTRCTSPEELPTVVQRALGTARLQWFVDEVWRSAAHTVQWRVRFPQLPDAVYASGSALLIPRGTSCERLVKGEVRVAIPVIGGKIEARVVEQLSTAYESAYNITKSFLAGGH